MAAAPAFSDDGIGIANLPNQRHKIVAKRGAHFTVMVVGESGLGKTTLINTLFSTELSSAKNYSKRHQKQLDKLTEVEIIKAELEEKQFKTKLTVIDTPGFGDYVNNRDSWTPIVDFIDDQHEAYMRQEQQPQRTEKIDLRVHACLYFIRPTGHTLKPLDIEIMKRLGTRVNLIPVVAKADTLTQNDLFTFKQRIRQVIQAQGIRVYQPPIEADDEVSAEHARVLSDAMPFSIIGSTEDVTTPDGRVVKGREYLWGVAEVENENHCDFRKLRSLLIRTYMLDLISTTEDLHYENYRQAQMETRKFGEQKPRKFENPKFKEEEEALRKRFTEQVKAEESRFRQWEQHVRRRLRRSSYGNCRRSCCIPGADDNPFCASVAYCRARQAQQGPRDGAQRDQGARGGAGQPAGWIRPRHGQAVSACRRSRRWCAFAPVPKCVSRPFLCRIRMIPPRLASARYTVSPPLLVVSVRARGACFGKLVLARGLRTCARAARIRLSLSLLCVWPISPVLDGWY
ncbi:Septin-domain-containing protein [Trametes meyenii]|nr:Septin-domain-containing protein [Trametes meyenii]